MEAGSLQNPTNAPKKMRFAPKIPPRKVPKAAVPKAEQVEDADAVQANDLLRRFKEGSSMGKPKIEKKATPSQVAFGYGGQSTFIKSYGAPKGGSHNNRYQGPTSDGGSIDNLGLREDKEYKEPWDYYSYYPVTLPLRRPYSGNPELLDEEEFAEVSESTAYDENLIKPAIELGLMEEDLEPGMFFLQLPESMPVKKRSASAEGQDTTGSLKQPSGAGNLQKTCSLDDLPGGFMGKMLVYRSGAVKLKLGDTLYDVSSGLDCVFAQDVVAINTEQKHCCSIGELNKRVILVPDVDSIISRMADLV
ncbi:uncharacterized protein LOC131158247 [Malania oleifera]|uniref:uncharacterized protein LOC131158247 n=1 Tax=Malania oleifera TaxID=397392 RepID=UPI0025AE83C3|nr:uncharacterized protein LOC131158247 [Malania oleifera]XP_057968968.1 uncharacterized protein LOC131158247 [Malania oleifera]XP_057968969.1 uncharacterized protein LOC131158247 [Malania oleifera]